MTARDISIESARQRMANVLAKFAIDYKLDDTDMVRLLADETAYWAKTIEPVGRAKAERCPPDEDMER